MALDLSCIFDVAGPQSYISCFDVLAGGMFWNAVYLAICFLIIGGWSYTQGIERGAMIGGFFCVLIGVGGVAIGALSVLSVMFAILMMLVGIFLTLQGQRG